MNPERKDLIIRERNKRHKGARNRSNLRVKGTATLQTDISVSNSQTVFTVGLDGTIC